MALDALAKDAVDDIRDAVSTLHHTIGLTEDEVRQVVSNIITVVVGKD